MNALYDSGREAFLKGEISWTGDDIRCVLVDGNYDVNLATDAMLLNIGDSVIATSPNLVGKTAHAGVADASDVTFQTVSGSVATAVAIFKQVTDASDSPLIAYIEDASGLPVTPNGGDITIEWPDASDRIFKL